MPGSDCPPELALLSTLLWIMLAQHLKYIEDIVTQRQFIWFPPFAKKLHSYTMQRRQQSLLSFFHGGSEPSKPSAQKERLNDRSEGCASQKSFSKNRRSFETLTSKMLRPSQQVPPFRQEENVCGLFSAEASAGCPEDATRLSQKFPTMDNLNGYSSSNAPSTCTDTLKSFQKTIQAADERMRCFGTPHAIDSSIPGIKRVREDQDTCLQEDPRLLKRKLLMEALGEGEEQKGLWEEAKAKFDWLNPSKVRDSKGRRMGEQYFDKRTLQIPLEALNKMTASQKQYWTVKRQYMDTVLFFKVGKFYELYELDAEIGHKELNWKMTVSGVGRCRQVGVSESGIEEAVEKLLARGYKVGRMEQVETAEQAKAKRGPGAMVQRKLTHVLTPSTAMDENIKPEAVHLLALREELHLDSNSCTEEKCVFGFAFVDAAAGQFYVGSLCDDDARSALGALLAQVVPRELLYELGGLSNETMKALRRHSSQGVAPLELTPLQPHVEFMEASTALSMINSHGYFCKDPKVRDNYGSSTNNCLEVLSAVNDCNPAVIALGALVQHLVRLKLDTSLLESSHLASYDVYKGSLCLDGQTLSNLEIFNNNADGGETGTLFSFLNNCSTPFGKRLLRRWICHPLQRLGEIDDRLDALEDFRNYPDLVGELRAGLRKLPDLERLVSQIHRFSASSFEATIPLLSNREKKRKAQAFGAAVKGLRIGIALIKSMNRHIHEGAIGSQLLLAVSNTEVLTEAHGLLDLMAAQLEEKFSFLKQSQKQGFSLDDKDTKLLNDLLLEFNQHYECWRVVTCNLAQLDVLLSFTVSVNGANGPTCRPMFISSSSKGGGILKIEQLWHPFALGAQCSGVFVRNNVELGSDPASHRAMLLTGPNMGGKSTLLRATCLTVILAQMGCYVPAESCLLSPVDTIFTRLGASDRIMSGESTFMVECMEASSVLRHATPDSLVILDELGRGTSTFDGYAIAYSVFRHLVDSVDCRLLFATHYHPLTKEFAAHPRVSLQHMACGFEDTSAKDFTKCAVSGMEINTKERSLVYLYKLSPGASPDSYGLHVASLAGLPSTVIERAEQARSILHSRLSTTFQKNAHRVLFSHVHDQWLRTILGASGQDESSCSFTDEEDAQDLLLCIWHELQGSVSKRR
ncbi:hypothetical protein GOP47_0027639 [Adiantum capillus-veneris]|nr:hypothetical protein GOP47_0027639 [Adiantum capillus-veneris]